MFGSGKITLEIALVNGIVDELLVATDDSYSSFFFGLGLIASPIGIKTQYANARKIGATDTDNGLS